LSYGGKTDTLVLIMSIHPSLVRPLDAASRQTRLQEKHALWMALAAFLVMLGTSLVFQ
jgi:hypothetical protein